MKVRYLVDPEPKPDEPCAVLITMSVEEARALRDFIVGAPDDVLNDLLAALEKEIL